MCLNDYLDRVDTTDSTVKEGCAECVGADKEGGGSVTLEHYSLLSLFCVGGLTQCKSSVSDMAPSHPADLPTVLDMRVM